MILATFCTVKFTFNMFGVTVEYFGGEMSTFRQLVLISFRGYGGILMVGSRRHRKLNTPDLVTCKFREPESSIGSCGDHERAIKVWIASSNGSGHHELGDDG